MFEVIFLSKTIISFLIKFYQLKKIIKNAYIWDLLNQKNISLKNHSHLTHFGQEIQKVFIIKQLNRHMQVNRKLLHHETSFKW